MSSNERARIQLTAWAPSVDIYEPSIELVVKADLAGSDPKDLDIRVENNILTIRGERKLEKKVNEGTWRVERAYGSFARSSPGEHRECGPSKRTIRTAYSH